MTTQPPAGKTRLPTGKTWLLVMALLLSVGVNLGLGIGILGERLGDRRAAASRSEGPAADLGEPEIPRRLERLVRRMADALELEGDEREAFLALQEGFFRDSVAGHDRLRAARAELRRELTSSAPDRARAEHWVEETVTAQRDLERAFLETYFGTRELLGPEQERKFRRFMGRLHQVRRELMERRERFRERRRAEWQERRKERREDP